MSSEQNVQRATAFAESYTPSEDDHGDLESRVVMFRRAVEAGNRRVIAAHARTLVRFLGHIGVDPTAGTDDGPSHAELKALLRPRDSASGGGKAAIAARIAEFKAQQSPPQE